MLCIISGTNREASNSQQSTTTSAHPINQQKKLVGRQRYRQESKSNTKPLQIGNTEEKKDSKKSKVVYKQAPKRAKYKAGCSPTHQTSQRSRLDFHNYLCRISFPPSNAWSEWVVVGHVQPSGLLRFRRIVGIEPVQSAHSIHSKNRLRMSEKPSVPQPYLRYASPNTKGKETKGKSTQLSLIIRGNFVLR